MAVNALTSLKPAQPRMFVPDNLDLNQWQELESLFRKLFEESTAITSPAELEAWILRCGELGAVIYQEQARRYIEMTCQTDNKQAEQAFLQFVEQIEPKLKPWWQKLDEAYLNASARKALPSGRWSVFDRETAKDAELFRAENVPLQTEEAKLAQQYQKIMGAMTVNFQGQELTLQALGRYLEEPERAVRQEAWTLLTQRRLQDKDRLEAIFDDLLRLRHQIARNADLPDYRAYAFKAKGRFDYGVAECEAFHAAVETHVVPLARELQHRHRNLLKLPQLRPWDLNVDPRNRQPLRPFEDVNALVNKTKRIFERIDPSFGSAFSLLIEHGLLDLESRIGKAPGGYQYTLEESRLPFIFMNAVGLQRDVETLLHEGGHAFHALATRNEPILMYRHAPMEFCEVASMSMELLGAVHLTEFYSPADAARARRTHLEGIVGLLPWIAIVDAFQHWIYSNPDHSRAERSEQWLALQQRFGGIEDWSGYELERIYLWHKQGHLFKSPFYYIEYGIAQLGALQIWLNARRDKSQAIACYRAALALGRSRPLPELFDVAGIAFDFSAKTVVPAMQAIRDELEQLEDA